MFVKLNVSVLATRRNVGNVINRKMIVMLKAMCTRENHESHSRLFFLLNETIKFIIMYLESRLS